MNVSAVKLIPLNDENYSMILAWRNSLLVRESMFNKKIISKQEHDKWYQNLNNYKKSLWFICMFNETPQGVIYFQNIDWKLKSAEWGFYTCPDSAPGTGTVLCNEGLNHARNALGLKTIIGYVHNYNAKSIFLHQKLGFKAVEENHKYYKFSIELAQYIPTLQN